MDDLLFEKMLKYNMTEFLGNKVVEPRCYMIFVKCLMHGHNKIALALEKKYSHMFPKQKDYITAFGYALVEKRKLDTQQPKELLP